MDEKFMQVALLQAKKALKHNEVPVGAVIVKNNKIISQAYNRKEKKHDCTKHAEMIAIKKACRKLKNWRLEECILYVTMEPCIMCTGAIMESRIKKVVYGIKNNNFGGTQYLTNTTVTHGVCESECKTIIQSFFKKRR